VRAPRAALTVALALAACARDTGGPVIPSAAIAFVDGATLAVVTRGRTIVLEGYGFGTTQGTGTVKFAREGRMRRPDRSRS
jgi:hypothetical protein